MSHLRDESSPLLPPGRPPMGNRSPSAAGPTPEMLAKYDVFGTILMIREDVIEHIDSPVSWDKMVEPEISFAVVRPLTEKYTRLDNLSIVYCLLSNRLQFLSDAQALPHARLNLSRASLCELLSIRCLNHYAISILDPSYTSLQDLSRPSMSSVVEGARQRRMSMAEPMSVRMAKRRSDELILANVLIGTFRPFAGAPKEVEDEEKMEGRKNGGSGCNALELAIVTGAKHFISNVACQKVITSVWTGRIYYTPSSFCDIIPDTMYKAKAITLYDTRKAPLLDHYRLRVPRYRMLLEFIAFITVFALMMIVLSDKQVARMGLWEIAFVVYTSGWALDRFASTLEHGWRVFAANLWNGIDAAIIVMYLVYLPLRLYGLATGRLWVSDLSLCILACESSLIFPRLAFFVLADNVLVISLRAMLARFAVLMFAAVWMFLGFWHALHTLDQGSHGVWEIAQWMINIWFGLDATGFDLSPSFHPWFGPGLVFAFACLANTLFITVVVAILSTTFAELNTDAKAEFMFRSAVGTLEGVKSDSLFSFQPPVNILALIFLLPASWVLTPRKFHSLHVFLTRLSNAPLLLLITAFERIRHTQRLSFPNIYDALQRSLPAKLQGFGLFVSGAHADIEAVFDYAPDTRLLARVLEEEEGFDDEEEGGGEGGSVQEGTVRSGSFGKKKSGEEEVGVWEDDDDDDDDDGGVGEGDGFSGDLEGVSVFDYGSTRYEQPMPSILSTSPKAQHSNEQLRFSDRGGEREKSRDKDKDENNQKDKDKERASPPSKRARRASFPEGGVWGGVGGFGHEREKESPMKKLFGGFGRGGRVVGGRMGSISENVVHTGKDGGVQEEMPGWAKELSDLMKSVEERQKRLEEGLVHM